MSRKKRVLTSSIVLALLGTLLVVAGFAIRSERYSSATGMKTLTALYTKDQIEDFARTYRKQGDEWFVLAYFGYAALGVAVLLPVVAWNLGGNDTGTGSVGPAKELPTRQ